MINVLAQGHITVTSVRREPAASQSRVKHSTTEPLRSRMPVRSRFALQRDNIILSKLKDDLSVSLIPWPNSYTAQNI